MADINPDTQALDLSGFPPLETIEYETAQFEVATAIVTASEPLRFFVLHETSQGWLETSKTYETFILSDVELGKRFPTVWEDVQGGVLTGYRFQTQDFGVWKFFRRLVFEVQRETWEKQVVPLSLQQRFDSYERDEKTTQQGK